MWSELSNEFNSGYGRHYGPHDACVQGGPETSHCQIIKKLCSIVLNYVNEIRFLRQTIKNDQAL